MPTQTQNPILLKNIQVKGKGCIKTDINSVKSFTLNANMLKMVSPLYMIDLETDSGNPA